MKTAFLPGTEKQLSFFAKQIQVKNKRILVIGSASEFAAEKLQKKSTIKLDLIVEDYASLINSKVILENNSNIIIRLMDYSITDFTDKTFDIIYAQASVSTENRTKIVKEIKRILKPEGIFCVGEIVALSEKIPGFISDILDSAALTPLNQNEVNSFYSERGFSILEEKNLNETLIEYYSFNKDRLAETKEQLSEQEKSYYKKLLNRISHESNAFLKQGGEKYLGFKTLILQKK